jgi:hypothetical protein
MVGVKKEQVKKVVITMECLGKHQESHSELWVDDISLKRINKKKD